MNAPEHQHLKLSHAQDRSCSQSAAERADQWSSSSSARNCSTIAQETALCLAIQTDNIISGLKSKHIDANTAAESFCMPFETSATRRKRILTSETESAGAYRQQGTELQMIEQQLKQHQQRLKEQQQMLLETQRRNEQILSFVKLMNGNGHGNAVAPSCRTNEAAAAAPALPVGRMPPPTGFYGNGLVRKRSPKSFNKTRAAAAQRAQLQFKPVHKKGHKCAPLLFNKHHAAARSISTAAAEAQQQQQQRLALLLACVSNDELSQALQQALEHQKQQQQPEQTITAAGNDELYQLLHQALQQPRQDLPSQQQQLPSQQEADLATFVQCQQQQQQQRSSLQLESVFAEELRLAIQQAAAQQQQQQQQATIGAVEAAATAAAAVASNPPLPTTSQHQQQQEQQQLLSRAQSAASATHVPIRACCASATTTATAAAAAAAQQYAGSSNSSCCVMSGSSSDSINTIDLQPACAGTTTAGAVTDSNWDMGIMRFNSSCRDLLSLLEDINDDL